MSHVWLASYGRLHGKTWETRNQTGKTWARHEMTWGNMGKGGMTRVKHGKHENTLEKSLEIFYLTKGCKTGILLARQSVTVGARWLKFTYVRGPVGVVSGPEFQIFVPTGCRTGQLLARQSVTV